jgi:hypothetical protein
VDFTEFELEGVVGDKNGVPGDSPRAGLGLLC